MSRKAFTRSIWMGARLAAVLGLASCSSDSTAPEQAVPVVDGVFSSGEWDGAAAFPISGPLWTGAGPGGMVYVTTDGTDLFIGVQTPPGQVVGDEELQVRFDNANDDVATEGDDHLALGPRGFQDTHYVPGSYQAPDARVDGRGAYGSHGDGLFFELQHPLSSGDPDDLSITPGSTIGLCLRLFRGGTYTGGGSPVGCIYDVNAQALYLDVVVQRPAGRE